MGKTGHGVAWGFTVFLVPKNQFQMYETMLAGFI
jgi:hypothetical protein